VISGAYLPGEQQAYTQEFAEAPDGVVELPQVSSGFAPDEYSQWLAINELGLHYVTSHVVYPNDLLDDEAGEQSGWPYLRARFDKYLVWLQLAAPGMRQATAREGAMAVQRFDRLRVSLSVDGSQAKLHLDGFYDEAWLLLRTTRPPAAIEGGNLTGVATGLYLVEAHQPDLIIELEK
jgi:hypothetical protein